MLLSIQLFAPSPEYSEWVAAVPELPECYGSGPTEALAVARAQAAALEHLADEIRSGARKPMDLFDSIAFVPEWDVGLGDT